MSTALIRARGLTRRFGAVTALRPLDWEVAPGSAWAVLGPNGAGKSTLLRLLAGLSRPSGGELRIGAAPGDAGDDRRARRRAIGLVAHETFLYPALTARENLDLAARLYGVADGRARCERLLAEEELLDVADRPAGAFSRGLAQRLAIARALVHDPALLLLDEPFTGLDPRSAARLAARLARLHAEGRTTLLVTHDLAGAAALAERALVLVAGRAAELGPAELADGAQLAAAYHRAVAALGGGAAA